MTKQEQLLHNVLSSSNLEEYTQNMYEFMKEENQLERIHNSVPVIYDMVLDNLAKNKTSISIKGLFQYLQIPESSHKLALDILVKQLGNLGGIENVKYEQTSEEVIFTWEISK